MKSETINGRTFEEWSPQEVRKAHQAGEVVIIDVRTPQEYAFQHIEGALLAPMATFDPASLPTQDGKRIIFHCGSGGRSRKVAEKTLAAGMDPIAHIEGGFGAWKEAGLPYIGTDPATGAIRRDPGRS